MKRRLFWKFLLIIVTGIVALFYLIANLVSKTEQKMSLMNEAHQQEITAWGRKAEKLYYAGDTTALNLWLSELQTEENTQTAIIEYEFKRFAGNLLDQAYYTEYNFGRNVEWPIHLYFTHAPAMEVPFEKGKVSFVVLLPERMRPGDYWPTANLMLQIGIPLGLLTLIAMLLYRHIMEPLGRLQHATRDFSQGNLSARVGSLPGNRKDELSELATTFDRMAARIGELIKNQRQLIADLSHELRTPLTRLEIAVDGLQKNNELKKNLGRIARESKQIRRLVEDSLSLAWLENERPELEREDIDLVDLLDVIIDDAKFEFPNRTIKAKFPDSAQVKSSNHLAVGQALENIVRNALRHTPAGDYVEISVHTADDQWCIQVEDKGPGVPEHLLETIFQPFFRVDKTRQSNNSSFGLGLSLARRQLAAVGGKVSATNRSSGGLRMTVTLNPA